MLRSFVATSSLLVIASLSASGWLTVSSVRAQRRADVGRTLVQLQSSLESSRFLEPGQQRKVLERQLINLSKGRSDVYVVRLRSGEVLLPPNWFEVPHGNLRRLLLGEAPNRDNRLNTGPLGDRFEIERFDLGREQGLVEVYRNITLEDQLLWSYVLQLLLFVSINLAVVISVGLWLSQRIIRPVLLLDSSIENLTPESLQNALVEIKAAPSELQHLAASTSAMARRLGEAWDAQKLFVSGVSHELRNSLTVISGYLARVQRQPEAMTAKQQQAINLVAEESLRLGQMFEQLLQISRCELGKQTLKLGPVSLIPLLQQVVDTMTQLSGRSIELKFNQEPLALGQPVVDAESATLSQVILNLLENAAKYSTAESLIVVELNRSDRQAIVAIMDQGIGIPKADQARIFERFYRASNASCFAAGSGLGLALDQLLIERMNGTIALASSGPDGSTFEIRLPLSGS